MDSILEMSASALAVVGAVYFALINLATMAAFGLDKRAAIRGEWRISEGTLLLFSALERDSVWLNRIGIRKSVVM